MFRVLTRRPRRPGPLAPQPRPRPWWTVVALISTTAALTAADGRMAKHTATEFVRGLRDREPIRVPGITDLRCLASTPGPGMGLPNQDLTHIRFITSWPHSTVTEGVCLYERGIQFDCERKLRPTALKYFVDFYNIFRTARRISLYCIPVIFQLACWNSVSEMFPFHTLAVYV